MSLIAGQHTGAIFDGEIPGPHGFLWGFIALEYFALLRNRVRLLLITSQDLIAIVAGGTIASPVRPAQVTEEWYDPFSYLSDRTLSKYEQMKSQSGEVLGVNRANWKCSLSDVSHVSFSETSKWGMGLVPYSGRLFVTVNGRQHEFILLGNQNGNELEAALRSGMAPKRPAVE